MYKEDTQPQKRLLDHKCLHLKLEDNYSLQGPQILSGA